MNVLLIGAGSTYRKQAWLSGEDEHVTDWRYVKDANITRLDFNPRHNPDVLHDLTSIPYPFIDEQFDRIDAFEVLEHTGQQGDYHFFFAQFTEFYRILKPNGAICGTCPSYRSRWAWGDPSHTRVLTSGSFIFLDQTEYQQVGHTPMSDFRNIYSADFKTEYLLEDDDYLSFILRAMKPARSLHEA